MSFYEIKNKADTSAEVWIYEQIGASLWDEGVAAKDFCRDLAELDVDEIALHINSPGGSVFEGQAIYNALRNHRAKVTAYIDGVAASIASVIAQAGDTVVMRKNSMMMVHNPHGGVMGSAEDMRQMADVLDKVKDTIVGVYSDAMTRRKRMPSEPAIRKMMDDVTWMNADEACEMGMCDTVADALAVAACFDYASLGMSAPPEPEPTPEPEPQPQEPEDAGATPDAPLSDTGRATRPARRLY